MRNIYLNGMHYCIAPTELNIFLTLLSYKDITPTEQFSIKGSEEECKCKYQIEIISGKDQKAP